MELTSLLLTILPKLETTRSKTGSVRGRALRVRLGLPIPRATPAIATDLPDCMMIFFWSEGSAQRCSVAVFAFATRSS